MKNVLMATLVAVLWLPVAAYAQTGTISGVVSEASTGDPLPGATVFVPALERGASTDIEGRYILTNVPAGEYQLRITFVGYRTARQSVTVTAGGTTVADIALQDDVLGLDDVIVVGYTQIPKREVTGAITSIRARDIEQLNIKSVDQAMQGRAAGVQVTNTSGQPLGGVQVRIRGLGSINASNSPLFVVDGVPISDADLSTEAAGNAIGGVNPQDIASIEILKDAAAASIYGAQASNGVVLITTKRGSAGATRFNVSSSVGSVEEQKRYDLLGSPEWAQLQVEAYEWWYEFNGLTRDQGRTRAINDLGLAEYLDTGGQIQFDQIPTTDWQDALMRTGFNRRIDVSANGGNEATRFYISGGYVHEEGTGIGTYGRRINLRSNVDHRASDLLALELNLNLANIDQEGALEGGYFFGSPFFASHFNRPIDPIFNDDGTYHPTVFNYNPVEVNTIDENRARTNHLIVSGAARFNLLDGLTFRSFYGLDYRNVRDRDYRSPESSAGASYNGYLFEADRQVTNFTTNQIFNYSGTLGGNGLSGLFGFEYRHHDRQTMWASGQGFPSGLFRTLQNAAEPFGVSGFGTEFKMASFLGQAKYDIASRYLLSVTGRYDGSSRFGEDRKWGLFYSGALAWVLSEESFMDWSNGFVDDLKFRVSYGVTGNTDGISDFAARQLFGSGGAYINQPALRPTSLGNNVLSWEGAQTLNLGLDWTVLGGRFYGALDVYRRDTDNLLLERTLPQDSGFESLLENVGSIRNEGVEVEVGAILVDQGGFQWTSDFNIGFHRNEVLELVGGVDYLDVSGFGLVFVGQPLGAYFLYEFAGVNPADGRPMFFDRNGNITYTPSANIETGDRKIVGSNLPDYFGGWNNRFTYRGLSLDALIQYNMGQLTNDLQSSFTEGNIFRGYGTMASALDRWTQPGDITFIERGFKSSAYPGRTSGLTTASTRYMQDASYVRLKNIRLSYTIPTRFMQTLGLHRASLYVQGTNLVTWTNYPGVDPEMVGSNTVVYPQPRAYTTGIDISF